MSPRKEGEGFTSDHLVVREIPGMSPRKEGDGFAPGDVVVLRSGGPRMTVTGVWSDNMIGCVWFTAAGEVREARFPPNALMEPGVGE